MKTSVDIPEEILKNVLLYSNKKTQKEAINTAMEEYIRIRKMRKLTEKLGTFDSFMTQADLNKMRKNK